MYEHNGNATLKHACSQFRQSLELYFLETCVEEHVEIFALSNLLPGLWMLSDKKINGKLC